MEAKPVDVNKADVAAPVPASSLSQEKTAASVASVAPSKSAAN
jgi:hypothetical protein